MIAIKGLAELAQSFPDDEWRELRILIRKHGDAADIIIEELQRFDQKVNDDGARTVGLSERWTPHDA
jgi:hypothetical protein